MSRIKTIRRGFAVLWVVISVLAIAIGLLLGLLNSLIGGAQ